MHIEYMSVVNVIVSGLFLCFLLLLGISANTKMEHSTLVHSDFMVSLCLLKKNMIYWPH